MAERLTPRQILDTLVGFPTVSRDTNLPLIDWVQEYLAAHGIETERHVKPNEPHKAALFAHVGPWEEGGVVLSGHSIKPTVTITTISAMKLLVLPLLVWASLHIGDRPPTWNTLLVLSAAGPSGAMAFALAMLHGVRTAQIAPVVIWTSFLSLVSLAWLA